MVDHYVRFVFPNSFKAQVVAVSREAAARYKDALDDALAAKVGELEKRNPLRINVDRLRGLESDAPWTPTPSASRRRSSMPRTSI